MVIIGIDPGLTGGIAWYNDKDDYPFWMACAMPRDDYGVNRASLASILGVFDNASGEGGCHMFLERVHAMPKNGAVSMFSFGRAYECPAAMAVMSRNITLHEVTPVKWQDAMLGKKPRRSELEVAQAIAPQVEFHPMTPSGKQRSKQPHSGMLDAVLIGEYGRRLLAGELK